MTAEIARHNVTFFMICDMASSFPSVPVRPLVPAATSRRRCVIQYRPASSDPPMVTTVGTSPSAAAERVGIGWFKGGSMNPSFSKGTSEM